MILPRLDISFRPLSEKHESLSAKTKQLIEAYSASALEHTSYAVIGTFGAGKTQFLFSIFKLALDHGLLPMYFLAEDLFAEIIKSNDPYTQGDLAKVVDQKVEKVVSMIRNPGRSADTELKALLGSREGSAALLQATQESLKQPSKGDLRPVLLVDELEVHYRQLQRRIQSEGDRSPLRELLSGNSVLKFFALAPAGIYEMGNADQTRVVRLIIPAADVRYINQHLLLHRGRANAAWWLSRGKARHLFKACDVLKGLPAKVSPGEANRVIKDQLDHIGQHPTQVPPADSSDLPSSKLPLLLDIAPVELEEIRCYKINTGGDEGKLADQIADSFNLSGDTAILFAEYFGATARALAAPDGVLNVPDKEVPDLLALALDHLLEYEHGTPSVTSKMGELLALYERLKNDLPSVYGGVADIWDHQPARIRLPLRIPEIRKAFPFPLMNPIVRDHEPQHIAQQVEGIGQPLWRWLADGITCLFFASGRDFAKFIKTDEFFTLCMPDGSGVLALLPAGQHEHTPKTQLIEWFREAGKLGVTDVPQLISDFLLSAIGELPTRALPGDLATQLNRFTEDKSDILLSRKAEIYSEAIREIVESAAMAPQVLCPLDPPDADNSWGSSKIADPVAAVCGVALAFTDLGSEHRAILSRLRELFKGSREGRGAGDLNRLKPRGGTVTLADDILPRAPRGKPPVDSQVATRLQAYLTSKDRGALAQLSRLVPLEQFLKLVDDDNRKRVLEALWRSTRHDFEFGNRLPLLADTLRYVKGQILPVIDTARALERNAKKELGLTGIDFGSDEVFVKAQPGFSDLAELISQSISLQDTAGAGLVRALVGIFANAIDVTSQIKSVQTECAAAGQTLDRLVRAGANLVRNFYEFPQAMRFVGVFTEVVLQDYVAQSSAIRRNLGVQELNREMAERHQQIADAASQFKRVQETLLRVAEVMNGEREDE